jgi:predicted RNA-binding Zn-ribbon protein involved in translation (DUF1610 family)
MIGINSKYPSPFIVPCTKCNRDIKLYTHQKAASFCCGNCGAYTIYDKQKTLKSNYTLTKIKQKTFKIGTVFKIEDLEFVLISFIAKEETSYNTLWFEYILFHPVVGYWTLNESDGHFTLIKPSKYYVQGFENAKSLTLSETGNYQLYSKYKYKIKHAEGEFFDDILEKSYSTSADYVNPPYILSYEKTKDEICWYHGEYIDHKTVKNWIKEDVDLPNKEGIAPNQPYSVNFSTEALTKITFVSVALVIICQFILSGFITIPKVSYKQTYYQDDSQAQRTYVSAPFEITENNSAADFDIIGNLYNNWLETDFTLVNETTGDQYYFSGAIEHYSGFSDGESWSEGSDINTLTVSQLKKGKYHFNLLVTNDINKPFRSLTVVVNQNVNLFSNFIFALICLFLFPLYISFKRSRFDRKQWYNSNYSPYNYD